MTLSRDLIVAIEDRLRGATGAALSVRGLNPVAGGCINENFRVEIDGPSYFIKIGRGAASIRVISAGARSISSTTCSIISICLAVGIALKRRD